MTRLLLLRHAESADPSVFHGAESDIGLSPRGRAQAERVAAWLAGQGVEALACSAMLRARDTAAPIARLCGLVPEIEPDLHERRVGVMGGTPTGRREGPWMDTVRAWMAGDTSATFGGAESFDEMRDRVVPVLERIAARHAGKTVAVVAHGAIIKTVLLSLLPGRSAAEWLAFGPIHNTAVSELVREEAGWRAVRLNERV
ncbi:MAG: histidine phosphatase family protein [Gemmataceae bacterium]|nr:histidine phosphatase family protein [Gemmataceae bacterium]